MELITSTITRQVRDINGVAIYEGMFIYHVTTDSMGTVLKVKDYGDIVVKVDSDPLPLTTRGCYLEVL